jgi:hypothetical protein
MKRTIRLDFEEQEYLMGFLNGEGITTPFMEYAIDITSLPNKQVDAIYNKLKEQGCNQAHMVTLGIKAVNEHGIEEYYEKPFLRTDVNNMMRFTIQAMKESE